MCTSITAPFTNGHSDEKLYLDQSYDKSCDSCLSGGLNCHMLCLHQTTTFA